MKFTANLILVLFIIPLFIIGILLSSVKFQLLAPSFWQTTFRSNNVYTNLANVLKDTAEQQTVKDGGSLQEARILTNLITPSNLQDLIEKNVKNILDFANGKTKEAVVYIPIKVLPKGLLPTNLGKIKENTSLTTLLEEFHVQGIQEQQVNNFSKTGQTVTFLLTIDIALLVVSLIGFFFLTDKGKRFAAPGVMFILTGVLILAITLFGYAVRGSMLTDWVKGTEPSQHILAPFAPYVLEGILKVWLIFGIFAILMGIVLIFLKKK